MKKLASAIAMAATLGAGSAFAVEDSEWGAWASTDSDALARILAAQHGDGTPSQPGLGAEDSALLDAGSILTDILNALSDSSGFNLFDPGSIADGAEEAINNALDGVGDLDLDNLDLEQIGSDLGVDLGAL